MNTWFTSDQHYFHKNVIVYCNRPYKDVEEMNAALIQNHNSVVAKDDTVFHVGDFSLSKTGAGVILPQLNGKHILIAGNHDHCHPVQCKSTEKLERMKDIYLQYGFSEIHYEYELPTKYGPIKINHLPYTDERERYMQYRTKDQGHWLLHGHVHEHWKQKNRQINVGVDVWNFTPVNFETLLELIKDGRR